MFRLAHISDVHLGPLPPFNKWQLLSKRLTGYVNWNLNRKGSMVGEPLKLLIAHLQKSRPDHIALTGDLVNLALHEEIVQMSEWLAALAPAENLSVIPGNHDAYVSNSISKIMEAWQPYMAGDQSNPRQPFPYSRVRADVCLIGLNSGIATAPFMATGFFDEKQADETGLLLAKAKELKQFRIIMIHHPPFPNATSWSKRLIGADRFNKMIATHGAELILHGHTHIDSFEWIEGNGAQVPVVGVPSASKAPSQFTNQNHAKPPARYNLFEISGERDQWFCNMVEYGFEHGFNKIKQLNSRQIYAKGEIVSR